MHSLGPSAGLGPGGSVAEEALLCPRVQMLFKFYLVLHLIGGEKVRPLNKFLFFIVLKLSFYCNQKIPRWSCLEERGLWLVLVGPVMFAWFFLMVQSSRSKAENALASLKVKAGISCSGKKQETS